MKIFTYLILISSLLVSCQSDKGDSVKSEQATTPLEEPTEVSTESSEVPDQQSNSEKATTEVMPDQFTLGVDDGTAKVGETICLNVTAANFKDMISMQYSFRWKPEVLAFLGVDKFQLPGLSAANFGTHRKEEGILTFVWIKDDLKGVSVENGASLYQLCFDVKGKAGEETTVRIWDSPTAFEAVTEQEELKPFNTKKGKVVIQ